MLHGKSSSIEGTPLLLGQAGVHEAPLLPALDLPRLPDLEQHVDHVHEVA